MTECIEYELQERDRLCFIHTPKTGGTTLTAILDSKFDAREICPAQIWQTFVKLSPGEIAAYRLLRGHFLYTVQNYLPQPPLFLTMLRHPIDRVISAYQFLRRNFSSVPTTDLNFETFNQAQSLTLQEFVCHATNFGCQNSQVHQLVAADLSDRTALDRNHLEQAKKHLKEFAFVGLTDQFHESLQLLSFTFGWNPILEHQPLMAAPTRSNRAEIEPDVIAAIADRNQLDLELYNYAIQLFEKRYQQMQEILQQRYLGTIDEQLEQHYQQRQQQRNLPQQSRLMFTFDRPLTGTGWQQREFLDESTCFCWTGPSTVSTLDLPLKSNRPLLLECGLINTVAADVLASLKLQVNGQLLPLTASSESPGILLRGMLTPAILRSDRNFVRFHFQVDRTTSWQSIDPNNPDHRSLGLAFRWIKIYPPVEAEFPSHDTAWIEVANYLQQHLRDRDDILAPAAFANRFPAQTCSYAQFNQADLPNWVVLHKGMVSQLGDRILDIRAQQVPVFANAVFIVFAGANLKLEAIASNEHLASLDRQLRQPIWRKIADRLVGNQLRK